MDKRPFLHPLITGPRPGSREIRVREKPQAIRATRQEGKK